MVQTVEVGGDPSLGRHLGLLGGNSEGRWGEEGEEKEDSDSEGSERVRTQHRSQSTAYSPSDHGAQSFAF